MDGYTEYLAERQKEISPEDDNYTDELLKIANSFRTFGECFDSFLILHGYKENISDIDAKITFIKKQFDKSNINFDTRTFKKCFSEQKRIDRNTAFKISFAFGLNIAETNDFFKKICLDRGFDCHDIKEAVYYYSVKNSLSYVEAQALIEKTPAKDVPNVQKSAIVFDDDVLFTSSIVKEIDRFISSNELLTYLNENANRFGYNNVTATKYIKDIWDKIADVNGLANKEFGIDEKERSVWKILLQILGLVGEDDKDHSPLYISETEKDKRTIKPILKDNKLLHPIAEDAFPDRDGIEKALLGKHISHDRIRKIIILFSFYRFWVNKMSTYTANNEDTDRCFDEINHYLLDCGYPTLYYGNPYDWLFMFCSQDIYPLETFRDFMRELYTVHQEEIILH